ncbi:unnamed protein product, partial [Rotaria magnacalcarata]
MVERLAQQRYRQAIG